jgi:outer membrane protein assembly factor BamB
MKNTFFILMIIVLYTAQINAQDWNVGSGGNSSRNCLSAVANGPTEADILWQKETDAVFHQQTVIDGEIVVTCPIIDINDVLHGTLITARDLSTGDTLWTKDLPVVSPDTEWRNRVSSFKNGVIYATRSDNYNYRSYMYALDASDGSILWQSDTLIDECSSESCSFTDEGNLIVGNLFDIICINATSGETIWQTPRPLAAPASGGQEVSVYGNRGYYWIANYYGPRIWVINLETGENLYSSESVSAGLAQQLCLFVGTDGTVYALRSQNNPETDFIVAYQDNGDSLIEKWRTPIGFIPFSTSGEGPDGSIYTYSSAGELIRLNPANGEILNTSIPFLVEPINCPRMAIDKIGQIFVTNGGENGAIYSFNPDLTMRWKLNVGVLWHSGPALADNGTLVISSSEYVIAFSSGTTAIENISFEEYTIYPNPAKDYLSISGLNENTNVAIYDMTSKLIYNKHVSNNQIDISNFQSGIYIVKIETAKGIITKKFVKQ